MTKQHNATVLASFLVGVFALLLAGCASQPAVTPPPQPTRDAKLEGVLQQQLGKINPDAVPVYNQATTAMDAGDLATSKKLYEQVTSMAPGFSAAYRRLGYIQASANDLEGAITLSQKALALEPNAYNQTALASLLLQRNTPKDSQDAYNLASSAAKDLPDDDQTNLVLLMSAAAVNNIPVARQADQHLLQVAPGNYFAHYFAGLLAAAAGNWEEAESQLQTAKALGMSADTVQHALDSGISAKAAQARLVRWLTIVAAGLLVVLVLTVVFFLSRRKRFTFKSRQRAK